MTLEGYDGRERILLHYDVAGEERSTAARVCQIVFGRVRSTGDPMRPRRKVEGFIHRPGVVWIGQSVLVLPPSDAEELAARLRGLRVRVSMASVPISRTALEAFRRRGVL
ncbi:MAG: hypothetical protein E6K16_04730 [Methanobacteriota archaeon]|nr:MAG: hypothetical protein E6K16_04730 [Euryarchaeota archaeon]